MSVVDGVKLKAARLGVTPGQVAIAGSWPNRAPFGHRGQPELVHVGRTPRAAISAKRRDLAEIDVPIPLSYVSGPWPKRVMISTSVPWSRAWAVMPSRPVMVSAATSAFKIALHRFDGRPEQVGYRSVRQHVT
jgi:hypothetical protein